MNHFGRSASLFMGHIGLVSLCFILFLHLHEPFHSNKQHVGNRVMVSAMKTDEIIMTILAAKLLGLFKNDQQRSKPPPPPPPPPPIAYPIIGACGRPKKCRKGGLHYFDLPDAYDDDDDFSVEGGAFNHFGDDSYSSGEIQPASMEMEYGNQYPTTYLTPDTPTAPVYQQPPPQPQPMQNYQTNYAPAGGGGGGPGGGAQHQGSYPPEQHSQAMQYSEPNTNEMDQLSSNTNRDFVTPRARLANKRKRLRKYLERAKKNRRGKGHRSTAKARRYSKSKQLKKMKTRTRRRKIRKLKPALVEQEELDAEEDGPQDDNAEDSDEQDGPSKQQQVIHLGEKPLSQNQQQEEEESEPSEHIKLEEEEPEEEELLETTTILSITNSTTSPMLTSTLSTSTSTSSEGPKQLIISYTSLQSNNNKTAPEEQSDHLPHHSKIMKMVPKKVRKYLEKLKLWNNKRLKKKKPQTLSNGPTSQPDSGLVENVTLDGPKQGSVPSLHDGEQDESPYTMSTSSGDHYNIAQAIPYDTYASMYGGAAAGPDATSLYASGPIAPAAVSASSHHSHEGIYMTPLARHPPSPAPALLPPLIISPGDILGEEYLFSPIMRRKSEQQRQNKPFQTEKRGPAS